MKLFTFVKAFFLSKIKSVHLSTKFKIIFSALLMITVGNVAFTNCSPVHFSKAQSSALLSTAACADLSIEAFKPKLKWDWYSQLDSSKPENFPQFSQVMASPVVGDINGDKIPEVVFVSWNETIGYSSWGVLRIVDGASGKTIRSVGESAVTPFACTTPLLIDIEGDGKAEIIYAHSSGKAVVALNHDGSTRWIYNFEGSSLTNCRGFSAIDSDKNGKAEIVIGSFSLTEDSNKQPFVFWKASQAAAAGQSFAMSLNSQAPASISYITSSGVYDTQGKQLFALASGSLSAANLDDQGSIEIVGTGGGYLNIVDGVTGEQKLRLDLKVYNELQCPGGIGGGPATLGDFDGDSSTTEIALATGRYLTIFNARGVLMAKYQTQDCSSLVTGISSFDFNGDGKPEILYGDEEYFRIFEMRNGNLEVVWSTPNPSGTLYEYPVVADIDGNSSSEILVVSNNYAVEGFYKDAGEEADKEVAKSITGVRAFEATGRSSWMPTRSVWNSFDYNPAFVTDLLRPVSATPLDLFTAKMFRRNTQLGKAEQMCQ